MRTLIGIARGDLRPLDGLSATGAGDLRAVRARGTRPADLVRQMMRAQAAWPDFAPTPPALGRRLPEDWAPPSDEIGSRPWRTLLDRLAGRVQLLVRLEPAGQERGPDRAVDSGRAWLDRRRASEDALKRAIRSIDAALEGCGLRGRSERRVADGIDLALLIDRAAAGPATAALAASLGGERLPLRVRVTGPWPPIAFAAVSATEAAA